MGRVQDESPELTAEQRRWLEENLARQADRKEQIHADMEALSDQRDIWIDEFLQRLQTRGFNYNCDALRKIPGDEMPEKPDRPFKVVF